MNGKALMLVTAAIVAAATPASAGGGGCGDPRHLDSPKRAGAEIDVIMHGGCVFPTVLRVQPGDAVTWVTKDMVPHTVTSGTGLWPEPHLTVNGQRTFAFRFDRDGIFPWYCRLHQNMGGAIVVGEPSATAPRTVAAAGSSTSNDGLPIPALAAIVASLAGSIGYGTGRRRARQPV